MGNNATLENWGKKKKKKKKKTGLD